MGDTNDGAVKLTEAAPEEKKIKLDPYIMLKEIQQMREEGMDEETIRDAFNQLMEEYKGNARRPQVTQRNSADKMPMMTQADINKMYEDALAKTKNVMSDDMLLLMEELERAQSAKMSAPPALPKPKLRQRVRMLFFKVLHFSLTKFLALIVWTFNKAGIK